MTRKGLSIEDIMAVETRSSLAGAGGPQEEVPRQEQQQQLAVGGAAAANDDGPTRPEVSTSQSIATSEQPRQVLPNTVKMPVKAKC